MVDSLRFPDVVPYLYYPDATAAVEFLVTAFGFQEHSALRDDDGVVWNAQLRIGRSLVMIGPAMDEFGTEALDGPGSATQRTHVLVESVDAVVAQARSAGATVLEEPAEHGDARIAIVADIGHHQWILAEPLGP